jgi:LPXTG-site transpeptidase (sortase) family protein
MQVAPKYIAKQRILAIALILFGLSIGAFSGWRIYQTNYQSKNLSFSVKDEEVLDVPKENQSSKPVFISIPTVNIKLQVSESEINNGIWEISETGVSHLDKSGNPGGGNNIVIYGHNKNSLFGPIRWLKAGDLIELTDSKNNIFSYKVVNTFTASPDEIGYILPKNSEILTLYTCTGILDSRRFIVVATLQESRDSAF